MLEDTPLYSLLVRVKYAKPEGQFWIECFTDDLKERILNLIRDDQLTKQGIDEAGKVIGYYSYVTELITRGRKQQGDHYTLNDTGDFFRSMFVTALPDSIVIDATSNSFKEMSIQEWYNDGILGLTDENLQKVIIDVQKKYADQIAELLYGNR
jgi:hypothetical protein